LGSDPACLTISGLISTHSSVASNIKAGLARGILETKVRKQEERTRDVVSWRIEEELDIQRSLIEAV
jgi:hypothetical protein